MSNPPIIYRAHAAQRMFERNISIKQVQRALATGEIIEDYAEDESAPSRLILSWAGKRPLHMVFSEGAAGVVLVTAYSPETARWSKDFKKRRG